tara:strand:- start:6126 stop:6866 length:741 start_codon:yes stop_codon:yes gene_type:complete
MLLNIKNNLKYILIIFLFLQFGCGDSTKKKMGIINSPPDEFQVYKQKELSVPPNFELRAPGSENSNNNIEEEAFLFTNDEKAELSINDEILLMSVGKNEVNSDIREIIDEDNSLKELDKSTLDKILDFEPIFEADKKENIINASEEKERLEKIKSEINDIDADVKEIENTNDKGEQKFEQTSLHSIATENDENRKPLADKNNKVDEEDSFLDKILDFDLFGSDDEEPDSENQRDSTFFNKEKKKSE